MKKHHSTQQLVAGAIRATEMGRVSGINLTYRPICDEINKLIRKAEIEADDSELLQEHYKAAVAIATEHSEETTQELIKSFPYSTKWPRLIINTFSMFSGMSGVMSAILPELMKNGFISIGVFGSVSLIFFLPAVFILPYFIKKAQDDISKEERNLRTLEILLHTKYEILLKEEKRQKGEGKPVEDLILLNSAEERLDQQLADRCKAYLVQHNEEAEQKTIKRKYFRTSLVEATTISITFFGLGIAALTTFATLSTPMGWLIISAASILTGIAYSIYNCYKRNQVQRKRHDLEVIAEALDQCERHIFAQHDDSAILALKAEKKALKAVNTALSAEVDTLRDEREDLNAENNTLRDQIAQLQAELAAKSKPPTVAVVQQNFIFQQQRAGQGLRHRKTPDPANDAAAIDMDYSGYGK